MLLLLNSFLLDPLNLVGVAELSLITLRGIPLFINLVIIENKTRLRDNICSKLPDFIHSKCLLEFEIHGVLLIICHQTIWSHQADIDSA